MRHPARGLRRRQGRRHPRGLHRRVGRPHPGGDLAGPDREGALHVGVLQVVLHVPDSHGLKDKRRVVRGLLDRVRARFPVAAAEVEDQDVWQTAVVGFASVSSTAAHAEEILSAVLDHVRATPGASIVEHELESMGTDD